jgi:glycerol-3-phosphate dehydrogenase (NAD(P)+)
MARIAILGSGVMGTALTFPLADNGHDVRLVGTHLDRDIIARIRTTGEHPGLGRRVPESVRAYQLEDAGEAFDGADVAMSGVNSFGVRWAGERFADLLTPGMRVIAIAKGMEASADGDLHILPDVLAEQVPADLRRRVTWSAIVGPSIAGELAARRPTCVVFAGHDQDALDDLAATFRTDYYHVWTSTDLLGAEVCAAMKNCYALSVGLAEGVLQRLGEGDSPDRIHNFEAAVFGQGAVEIGRMLSVLGGRSETLHGLAGVGDMYVTSAGGRNIRLGRQLGAGKTFSEAVEAVTPPGETMTFEGAAAIRVIGGALPRLTERGLVAAEDLPLMRHLHGLITEQEQLRIPWSGLFGGEPVSAGGTA